MRTPKGVSSVIVTAVTGLIVVLILLFLRQVYIYYRQIRSGDSSGLPQWSSSFSFSKVSQGPAPATASVATADDPSLGPSEAVLTVVEFLDYQCPFCNESSSVVRELTAKYGDRIRFIIRDFPVQELHPDAVTAAEAAGCAEAQGKYWTMHDRLFALKGKLARKDLDLAARQSGLDAGTFAACMDAHVRVAEIQEDLTAGQAAGVRGTPTFFFNGRRVEGSIPHDAFETLLKGFLGE